MILKDIEEFTKNWKSTMQEKVAHLEEKPILAIVQIGESESSDKYLKDCTDIGIRINKYIYSNDIDLETFLYELKLIQEKCTGVVVQLPLPAHLDEEKVIAAIDDDKDVCGFKVTSKYKACAPGGVMKYLEYCEWNPEGKGVVIIGRRNNVGKPLARMMIDADATVTLCHSKTQHLRWYIDIADLIVCDVGQSKFLNCYAIHVPVVDLRGSCFNTEDTLVALITDDVIRCMVLENAITI